MRVLFKRIIKNERLCFRKEKKPTQHIVSTKVFDDVGPSSLVSSRNAKMVVTKALIFSQVRLSACKGK